MSLKKSLIAFMTFIFILVSLQSCYKVTTLIEEGEEVNDVVSMTNDILPVFNTYCSISGCHNSGGIKPDLSESNAYSSLSNGGYFNVEIPNQSELYLWLSGQRSVAMPPGGPANPSNVNQLVLAWIKQGALNN